MRLLHTSTLKLHEFFGDQIPNYAILSHTWGSEEVQLQDLDKKESKSRAGYAKITRCCALALASGWQYVWMDTCCIDKSSSAELSEAINSMYEWYHNAQVCYAHLADVSFVPPLATGDEIQKSRWFTRGWTLQELLAPGTVIFYDRDWVEVGTKWSLRSEISGVTGIGYEDMANPKRASIAAKMSWASRRQTTRLEDSAYSLLGLFDLNMPLLYGEGIKKAFMRLQYELLQARDDDESLFAWEDLDLMHSGMLAQSPAAFQNSGDIVPFVNFDRFTRPPKVTRRLLLMNGVSPVRGVLFKGVMTSLVTLNCTRRGSFKPLGITLAPDFPGYYMRSNPGSLVECDIARNTKEPSADFFNNSLEIWLDRAHTRLSRPRPHKFHVRFPLLIPGFRLAEDFLRHPAPFCQLSSCWETELFEHGPVGTMRLTGNDGESFALVLAVQDDMPSIDVFVPKAGESLTLQDISTRFGEACWGDFRGADTVSEPLQSGHQAVVILRKEARDGAPVNVVDVSVN